MQFTVAGLGNPGEEYTYTRHNVGRMVVEELARLLDADSAWRTETKLHARVAETALVDGTKIVLVQPDNYMNRSGGSIAPFIKSRKAAEQLVVIHDDIDLPFGTLRLVSNRGSGGHRGVESIVRAIKTSAFIRVRVGVLPTTPSGKTKKPKGGDAVHTFILKPMRKNELEQYKPYITHTAEAVLSILTNGLQIAMCNYNGTMENRGKQRATSKKRT